MCASRIAGINTGLGRRFQWLKRHRRVSQGAVARFRGQISRNYCGLETVLGCPFSDPPLKVTNLLVGENRKLPLNQLKTCKGFWIGWLVPSQTCGSSRSERPVPRIRNMLQWLGLSNARQRYMSLRRVQASGTNCRRHCKS